ncbi:MAG: hypothetical protein LBF58_10160 [Deltaproteobacteria bacterium]|jgi:hypothetical protein|nr:hypothetical protein [Deltaproteobacteria bacterium]
MSTAKPFIRLENRNKKRPELIYARVCTPQWVDKKKINNEIWLGRVVNIENSVFYSREKGYFRYTIEDKFIKLTDDEIKLYKDADKTTNIKKKKEHTSKSINHQVAIQFGDIYIINEFITNNNFLSLFEFSSSSERDTILSLIAFKIINCTEYSFAQEWYNTSYAKFLYPLAQFSPKKINQILSMMGTENYHRNFFINYAKYIKKIGHSSPTLTDINCLPNDTKHNITVLNIHNNVINNQFSLILLIDKTIQFPIYYQYLPKMILKSLQLRDILYNIKNLNVNIDMLVLDNEYYSEENLTFLNKSKIPFIISMNQNGSPFEFLITKSAPIIKKPSNSFYFEQREIFVIKTQIELFNSKIQLFAYVCLDPNKQYDDYIEYQSEHDYSKITDDQFKQDCMKHGIFILLSTIDLQIDKLLNFYYSRPSIEYLLDIINTDLNLLSSKTTNHIIFNGYLMISFISNIIIHSIEKKLKEQNLSFSRSLYNLSHHFARIYRNNIIPNLSTNTIKDICKALETNIPIKLPIQLNNI